MSSGDINGGQSSSTTKLTRSQHNGTEADQAVGFQPQKNMTVQPPKQEDLQRSYATVVDSEASPKGWYGSMINTFGAVAGTMGAIPCCIVCPNPYNSVSQGNVGLVTKFGRFYKAVDPGLVKINPLSERLIQIDVKIQIAEVPEQTCMTKDNVTLRLTSVIYFHVVAPHKAAFGITNVRQALIERTQTTLRHVVGARILQDVIERREEIAQSIGEIIEDVAAGWGVQVEAAKLMRQAADILSSAPAMQIRYLEAMQAMAKSANSKVIFLPAANQTMNLSGPAGAAAAAAAETGEDLSRHGDFGGQQDPGFQSAMNARIVENI
ncbi:Regulator of protease HflC, stomatin/prohibitin superfamily [Geosmithia morbida]|uniref:Regulator of protease HflC, stomatin/prohibitin superfamily n=1 Tax=Geosmithia morbida TaxID=1094350 RepID=A0A9P4Z2S1_9HYPO|nr:Regulator of protease HflC, stomatin/prohibitin superfamily [Geosmithia morbida]KAF4126382.1 Regulator of protease HflC, stomatin/prohibitin superfamily [Geosmithia morbida]